VPLEGDLLKKENGGLFVCTDVQTDRERALRGEVSPTGPMIGVKMRTPLGRPAELEQEIATRILGPHFDLAKTKALGEGTRRSLRLVVEDVRFDPAPSSSLEQGGTLRVCFVLPKGAYATTVLAAAIVLEEPRDRTAPASGEPDES